MKLWESHKIHKASIVMSTVFRITFIYCMKLSSIKCFFCLQRKYIIEMNKLVEMSWHILTEIEEPCTHILIRVHFIIFFERSFLKAWYEYKHKRKQKQKQITSLLYWCVFFSQFFEVYHPFCDDSWWSFDRFSFE